MLTVDEVLQVIVREIHPVTPRQVALGEAAGAILAQDVKLEEDSPAFDRSQLDGFAVRAADVREGGGLKLAGRVDAGGVVFSGVVQAGECVAINTGGVVPAGADAILMVEQADIAGDQVTAKTTLKPGFGIQARGSDARAGEILLQAGTVLRAAQLAACAAAGVAMPLVRKVRIAVLTTGDELVDNASLPLAPGKIRNSNRPMLLALAAAAGAEVIDLGTCGDDAEKLRAVLGQGLAAADLLVVSGGMSMGTRDLVPPLLKELGVRLHVEKVRIKPGKPFILGSAAAGGHRCYVAGLPGNPVSGFVTFQRFVRAVLARMVATPLPLPQPARIVGALPPNGDREFYQPCVVLPGRDGRLEARVLAWKGSADLFTLARANGLVIQPIGDPGQPAGSAIDVLIF
jgi:molybdopterin molybdotransferase